MNSLLFSLSGKFQLLLDLQLSPEAEAQRVTGFVPTWLEGGTTKKTVAFICSQLLRRKQMRPKRAQDRRYVITFDVRCNIATIHIIVDVVIFHRLIAVF